MTYSQVLDKINRVLKSVEDLRQRHMAVKYCLMLIRKNFSWSIFESDDPYIREELRRYVDKEAAS